MIIIPGRLLFVCLFVVEPASLSRPKASSPRASCRHREGGPACECVSYDRRIVFSYACVGAFAAVQDARRSSPNRFLVCVRRRVRSAGRPVTWLLALPKAPPPLYVTPSLRTPHPTRDLVACFTTYHVSRITLLYALCAHAPQGRTPELKTGGPTPLNRPKRPFPLAPSGVALERGLGFWFSTISS